MQYISSDINDNSAIVENILKMYPDNRFFSFFGNLGAGKTTLIKLFCQKLGVQDIAKSPSFAILNQYPIPSEKTKIEYQRILHFDFYRINNEDEVFDLGYEEFFYSNDYCFIEWPEKILNLLPAHYVKIELEILDKNKRKIIVTSI